MAHRLYIVTNTTTNVEHLVQADSQAQAVRYLANDLFAVAIARPLDVARLMADGTPILSADPDPQPE